MCRTREIREGGCGLAIEWNLAVRYHRIMKYESMIPGGTAMAPRNVSTVQERGQVTIPREIRERLGLGRGS